jgi:protocatechuate 3,4-dioxygenase beta subunit
MQDAAKRGLDRRQLLTRVGAGLVAVPLAPLSPLASLACSRGTSGRPDERNGSDGAGARAGAWASGGTAAMTDRASYPDPFAVGAAVAVTSSCPLTASATEGPCTTSSDLFRHDVSEGWSGLPVRLALKVVDHACAPVVGAAVKIWHTNREGLYSGDTLDHHLCSANQLDYVAASFFRGVQTTGADGTVHFDTCFPGWYRGRAIHIHFQVGRDGTTYQISQLFFPEAVTAEIFASHPDYRAHGQPDTVFASDGVLAGIATASRGRHIVDVDVARMTDGAMLASKVLAIV